MLRNTFCLAVLGLVLAGCSMMSKKDEWPDDTPTNATAVLETHLVSDGVKGFFPFDGTSKSYTRAAMRRDDSTLKGTGTITRFIVGTTETSRIERLDRKLVWTMDAKEKTYTECPLKGCSGPVAQPAPQEKKSEKQEKPHEPECKVKIANASFTVTPTGQKRSIDSFDTDEYRVAWVITLQDPTARKTVSTLNVDLWTTPMTSSLKEALAVEQTYARTLAAHVAGVTGGSDKTQVVPAEAAKMIEAYVSRMLSPADRAAFLSAGRQMEKIKGYPVLTELSWNMQGDACAEKEGEGSAASGKSSSSDLLSSVTDFFAKKKADDTAKDLAAKPIFSFTSEVKSHKVEPVHDSVFSPPRGYTLANPK
ncbi:MAG TPA: hypothetical protein VLV86_04530 [Vicinamibacterales bacterium]|nr:hypothetical protein [Vicinamibacterales bacterium]